MSIMMKRLLAAALLAAVPATSFAQTFAGSASPVAPNGQGGSDLGSAQLFAVINFNGNKARGKGEGQSARIGLGYYRVGFTRNVASCAYIATVGGVATEVATGFASVTRLSNSILLVRTFAPDGVQADRPFHLYVDC